MNCDALILAGGKSARMGRDKAWIKIDGQSLLKRQIQLAGRFGASEIFISGRPGSDYQAQPERVLEDEFQNAGPLAGIERGLANTTAALLLVLAVDMPAVTIALLTKLGGGCTATRGVIPRLGGHAEPLVAFYPKAAHSLAVELLRRTESGLRSPGPSDFARRCVADDLAAWIEVPATEAGQFANLNAPEDVAARGGSVL